MFANNETGVLQPIAEVVRLARAGRRAGALRRRAGRRQGAGRSARSRRRLSQPLRPQARRPDGRRRAGRAERRAVCVRTGVGGGQESNRRAGTENVAGIAGFGAAAAAVARWARRSTACATGSRAALLAIAPGARVFGAGAPRLRNTTLHLHAGREGRDAGHGARSRRRLRQRGRGLLVGQGAPLGRAGGHGRRRCRGRDGDQNKLRLEHRIRRYRTLDRGLAGPIYPSRRSRIFAKPGQPRNFKGLA